MFLIQASELWLKGWILRGLVNLQFHITVMRLVECKHASVVLPVRAVCEPTPFAMSCVRLGVFFCYCLPSLDSSCSCSHPSPSLSAPPSLVSPGPCIPSGKSLLFPLTSPGCYLLPSWCCPSSFRQIVCVTNISSSCLDVKNLWFCLYYKSFELKLLCL